MSTLHNDPIGKITSIQVTVYKEGTSTVMIKGARYNAKLLIPPAQNRVISQIIQSLRELITGHNALEDIVQRQQVLTDGRFARQVLNSWQERQIEKYKREVVMAKDTGQWINIAEALQVLWQLGWDAPLDWHLDPIMETLWYSADSELWDKHPDLVEHPFWGLNWISATPSTLIEIRQP